MSVHSERLWKQKKGAYCTIIHAICLVLVLIGAMCKAQSSIKGYLRVMSQTAGVYLRFSFILLSVFAK